MTVVSQPTQATPKTFDEALSQLLAIETTTRTQSGAHSLAPGKAQATPLSALVERLVSGVHREPLAVTFAGGLASLLAAMMQAFPDNLFWDFDLLATDVLRHAEGMPTGVRRSLDTQEQLRARLLTVQDKQVLRQIEHSIRASFEDLISLQQLFGGASTIRFRYAHDFIYGFDWAKWVRRAPAKRAGIGPFDRPFLAFMLQRGQELIELIAQDDSDYPRLTHAGYRNPFRFSRSKEDELRLFTELSRRDLLPLRSWDACDQPRFNQDYRATRERIAEELGLASTD
ncbi:MAG: hypothetical protein AAF550_15250 [Myxococcota bacterium]